MRKKSIYVPFIDWMDQNIIIHALRKGLLITIPIILIGSFAQVITSLPLPQYQKWLQEVFGGILLESFTGVYSVTLQIICLYLTLTISYSYASEMDKERRIIYPLCSFLVVILLMGNKDDFNIISIFGVTNLFFILLITIIFSIILHKMILLCSKHKSYHYKEGIDIAFQNVCSAILPTVLTFGFAFLLRIMLSQFALINGISTLKDTFGLWLFNPMGKGFFSAFVYILLSHLLWFFGIHGSNLFYDAAYDFFEQGISVNQGLIAIGKAPTEIYTKSFFDTFVHMGGCGATICLILAMVIASKRSKYRKLFSFSAVPTLFNINEPLLFGIPVVFNPIIMLPFVITPLVLLVNSSLAVHFGLVPMVVNTVHWTTPIIFSGILATHSWTGGFLQLINLCIGTLIYIPFIRLLEKQQQHMVNRNIDTIKNKVIEGENRGTDPKLLESSGQIRDTTKMLIADLKYAISSHKIELFYQPQVYSSNSLMGAEALLRWNHPITGYLYPPLVIALSKEADYIDELGIYVIEETCKGIEKIAKETTTPLKISVNISPVQLKEKHFCEQVELLLSKYHFGDCKIAFELTEQIALEATSFIVEQINRLRQMGIMIIMDDFGMGHSSMTYLQNNEFDFIKLDGNLVKSILTNKKSEDIIDTIQKLSHTLGCELIAEYVETIEQRDRLKELNCDIYQGYLFGKAIELDMFIKNYVTQK